MNKNLKLFFSLIQGQLEYGAKKYSHNNKKESTDCLFEDFGYKVLFGFMGKYYKRFSNVERERDLLKIATYSMILWLKRGFHIVPEGTLSIINTTIETKSRYFNIFKESIKRYNKFYINKKLDVKKEELIDNGYRYLVKIIKKDFIYIHEFDILTIFNNAFIIWDRYIKNKGQDQDLQNIGDKNNGENII